MEIPICTPVITPAERAQALADPTFRLIETFGYVPGQAVQRFDLHLSRMQRSATAFGIAFDREQAVALVDGIAAEQPKRCRFTLAANGEFDVTLAEMPAAAQEWRFTIAPSILQSEDVFLQHKTTCRGVYDDARRRLPAGIDEYVFVNERGEVCEGTITNVVVVTADERWLTPARTTGCLPGVFRQSLLAQGRVSEAVISQHDLTQAQTIYLTNALRGLIVAKFVAPQDI